jgi:hypothetical protein
MNEAGTHIAKIRASWASMARREDYVSIVSRMNTLASQHGATLPELLLK